MFQNWLYSVLKITTNIPISSRYQMIDSNVAFVFSGAAPNTSCTPPWNDLLVFLFLLYLVDACLTGKNIFKIYWVPDSFYLFIHFTLIFCISFLKRKLSRLEPDVGVSLATAGSVKVPRSE